MVHCPSLVNESEKYRKTCRHFVSTRNFTWLYYGAQLAETPGVPLNSEKATKFTMAPVIAARKQLLTRRVSLTTSPAIKPPACGINEKRRTE